MKRIHVIYVKVKRNVGDRVSAAAVRKYNLHSQVAQLLSAADVRNHIRSLLFNHTLVLYRPGFLLHFFPFERIPSIFWWFVFIHTLGHRIVSPHITQLCYVLLILVSCSIFVALSILADVSHSANVWLNFLEHSICEHVFILLVFTNWIRIQFEQKKY